MPVVTVTLPSDGDDAVVEPYNDAINAILATLNGNLDDDNIASMNGAKIVTGSLPSTAFSAAANQAWKNLSPAPTAAALGNRMYQLSFATTDITSIVSNGMRIKTVRTVPAPQQCTLLNGTNQFFNKTSPSGMTFTDDFVVSAWIKLNSYNSAANQIIASRFNNTSGWRLMIDGSGRLDLDGFNASGSNFSNVVSVQSVPIGKWVHVTAQLDMSTFTATPTTSYTMIDGLDVPATVARGGTNPTALIQAGNLEIGSNNGGTSPLNGEIAQVAIYSAKVTQANILATISQGLVGTETSLISAYSFNNSIADLNTSNANNLTANNSAVATKADSPFGSGLSSTLDYAIVMAASFSTNTTLTVQVPEGYTIPTSGGVASVTYSTDKIPYGFPAQRGRWRIEAIYRTLITQASPTTNQFYNPATQLSCGLGAYIIGWEGTLEAGLATAGTFLTKGTLSTTNNTETYSRLTSTAYAGSNATTSGQAAGSSSYKDLGVEFAAPTTLFFNFWTNLGTSSLTLDGGAGDAVLFAENAYI